MHKDVHKYQVSDYGKDGAQFLKKLILAMSEVHALLFGFAGGK